MGKYFGTDGFRGEANVQLTVDHAFKVGRYVGWYYAVSYTHLDVYKRQPQASGKTCISCH